MKNPHFLAFSNVSYIAKIPTDDKREAVTYFDPQEGSPRGHSEYIHYKELEPSPIDYYEAPISNGSSKKPGTTFEEHGGENKYFELESGTQPVTEPSAPPIEIYEELKDNTYEVIKPVTAKIE